MHKYCQILAIATLSLAGLGCNPSTPEPPIASTPDAIASPASPSPSSPTQIDSTLSQFQNRCQGEETAFVFAETREYWLNICGEYLPEFLVAINKQDTIPVRIPITDYDLQGKWFEAMNTEREYVLGFQGVFEEDIFFAITQLKPDKSQKPKYFRELTKQPLIQIQAHLTSAATIPKPTFSSSPRGTYQSEEYTLTIDEIGGTFSYWGCTAEDRCIFIPRVSQQEGNTLTWEQDNLTYIFSLEEESDRYRLQVLDAEGKIASDRFLQAVSTTP